MRILVIFICISISLLRVPSMIIPSVAGLPIHFDVNGTGTVDLVLSGKMDLRKLGSSPRSLDIDGEVRPSAAIEITGTMFVDAMVTKTGLRMRNTLHTSTALKGRVQLERGQLLNMEFETPQDKMEIFSAGSKFFIIHNDVEKEQAMMADNRQEYKVCSGGQLATIFGMEMCGELSFPNASMATTGPYFPLTGPTSGSLTLYKKDSHKSYKIFVKRVENKKASIAQISLNTPGSKTDRAILMEVNVNYPKQTLDAIMRTPWKKGAVRAVTINKDNLKSFTGSVVIDDEDTYAFTSEVKVDKTKNQLQLSPVIEVRRVGADNVQVTGYLTFMTPFKSADIDLSLSGLSKMPYNVKSE
ncbi:apolipophorins-like [Aplysia californica]|uniref:Apolipophorins-like n=1 Tax=Aplysia californica TaxID=6500 RepID=A0ABM1A074_APLCA|nr:apolipophorins-like [Aplysia californica]